ncbi:MAG: TlpA disulfide reductase family protein [Odoribacter sp.]
MNRIKLVVLFVLLFNFAFGEGKQFVINGSIEEIAKGRVWVITQRVSGLDTLGGGDIVNGMFKVVGNVDEPVVALITIENYQGGFVFILDTDAPYQMNLKKQERSTITGGKLQTVYTDYQEMVLQSNKEMQLLKEKITEAVEVKHFKTATELQKKLDDLVANASQKVERVLDKNKDNVFTAYIRAVKTEKIDDLNILKERYAILSEKARNTEPAKILAARIARMEQIEEGNNAPDFTLQTPDGQSLSLYKLKGKIKIVDFWASWCGPCRLENPNMVKLYKEFKDRGLVVLSVSLDQNKEKWMQAIEKDGMVWYNASSLKGWTCDVVKKYAITAVPTIFVLDANNRIIATQLRGEKLHQFVAERL